MVKAKAKWPQVYQDPDLQARYEELRAAGNNDQFAQMLAEQRPPGTKGTERAFSQNRGTGGDIDAMCPISRKTLLENCKRMGINPSGKMYIGQLARKGVPLDPLALVNNKDDVRARAAAMGKYVDQEPPETPPPKSVVLAEDIIREQVAKKIAQDPRLKKKPKAEIREQVIDQFAYKRKDRT